MKKVLLILVVFSALVFPLACNDINNTLTSPEVVAGGTATPTPSSVSGAVFLFNYGTSSAPNGMSYYGGILYVACAEAGIAAKEHYIVNGDGSLIPYGIRCPKVVYGCPTPSNTPAWEGPEVSTYTQAYLRTGNIKLVLDSPPSGSAVLYQENASWSGVYSFYSNSYDGIAFASPKGVAVDSTGTTIYVADTGNAYIDVFLSMPGCPEKPEKHTHIKIHRWNGSAPNLLFVEPRAIVCDSADNVIVADAGYSPSIIQTYTTGGTTIINHFQTIPNCIAYGLAVDSSGNIFVADVGNNLVEVYDSSGNLLRMWGDPHSPHEYMPFKPACLALVGDPVQYVIVGDIGNDLIQVFQY